MTGKEQNDSKNKNDSQEKTVVEIKNVGIINNSKQGEKKKARQSEKRQ